jgi:hypothetical protein
LDGQSYFGLFHLMSLRHASDGHAQLMSFTITGMEGVGGVASTQLYIFSPNLRKFAKNFLKKM